MDLSTPARKRLLKYRYDGTSVMPGKILYTPVKITRFEIADSTIHPGKKMVVAQVVYLEKDGTVERRVLFTESYTLIDTLKETEGSLPHYTKIVRKRDGFYYFAKLNDIEKRNLVLI